MKTLEASMRELGLSKAKEYLFYAVGLIVIIALAFGIYIWKGFGVMLIIPAVGLILYTYLYFGRYGRAIRTKKATETEEFIRLFTFFGIYVNNGYNVYHALESIVPFAGSTLKERLECLLRDIEEDKTVTPFIHFASFFPDMKIKEVMVSIYAMIEEGGGGAYIARFQHIFGKLSDDKHLRAKEKRVESLQNLSFLPLLGSGIAMLMLTVALMEIMGSLMNVV